jgi:phosphoribosylanthranilate isomerase
MKPKLKICGMKNLENIQEISTLEPDFLGFIFWEPSKRYFNLDLIPILPKSIKKVGVFVNAYFYDIIEKVNQYKLDFVQLHGNESPTLCKDLKEENITIIKAFSIDEDFDFSILKRYENHVDYFLFDTKGKLPGGNGTTFNWKILENYNLDTPFFLSGGIGLNQTNQLKDFFNKEVSKKCYAIDVNSQFETEAGIKDRNELKQFQQQLNTF